MRTFLLRIYCFCYETMFLVVRISPAHSWNNIHKHHQIDFQMLLQSRNKHVIFFCISLIFMQVHWWILLSIFKSVKCESLRKSKNDVDLFWYKNKFNLINNIYDKIFLYQNKSTSFFNVLMVLEFVYELVEVLIDLPRRVKSPHASFSSDFDRQLKEKPD